MKNVNSALSADYLDSLSRRIADLAAAIIFPGFLVYHTLISTGTISAFLGGYASVLLAVTAAIFFALIPFRRLSAGRNLAAHTIIFFLFSIFALSWSFFISANSSMFFMNDAFKQVVSSIVLLLGLFFIGFYFDFNSFVARKFMPFALIMCAFLLFLNYIFTGSIMFYAAYDAGTLNEQVATYQGYAVNTLFIAVLALGGVRGPLARFVVIGLGLVALFFLGSRSEFLGFALGGLVVCTVIAARTDGGTALAGLFAGIAALMWMNIGAAFGESRFAELSDIQNADSVIARDYLSEQAWNQILDNPIVGFFGGHFLSGGEGAYAHNLLSAWVSFGAIGFLAYCYLALYPAWKGFEAIIIRRSNDSIWWPVLLLGVCVFVLMIFAKPVYWEGPGLLFGLLGQALYSKNTSRYAQRMPLVGGVKPAPQ